MSDQEFEAMDKITALEAEVARLKAALDVCMLMHTPYIPGDSRAVPDWFVACAAVSCGLDDDDGKIAECLSEALCTGEIRMLAKAMKEQSNE